MKKIKHARPTPKCELILACILKHGVQTNTMLAHAPASPPPQLPFVYLYVGRCAASAGDRGPGWRPFPARVFLRCSWIGGRHRPWITHKKQPWRNPKKEKNSLSCASVDWHSLTQRLFLEDLSVSASFSPGPRFFFCAFFLPGYFLLTSMRKDANEIISHKLGGGFTYKVGPLRDRQSRCLIPQLGPRRACRLMGTAYEEKKK